MGNLASSTDFNIYLSKKEEKEISLKFDRFNISVIKNLL